jgi:hypothetical protein
VTRLAPILTLITVLLLLSDVAQARQDLLSREEYAIYSAIISKHYMKQGVRLVVVTTPTCCEASQGLRDDAIARFHYSVRPEPFPSPETWDSYVERNRTSVDVQKLFKLTVALKIVPYKKIESLFDMIELDEDWKTFYRMFPHSNGYIRFSRAGFNRAGDEAFVSTAWMSGSLSGEGRYILLRKNDGRWNIETSITTWVS